MSDAWQELSTRPAAALVDVRTTAEWSFVGLPDLSGVAAPLLCVEWQSFPSMQVNSAFVDETEAKLAAAGIGRDAAIYLLCRSGARSASAAAALTAAGYAHCFNVAGGFEGARNAAGHRGMIEGWKAAGLPWSQS